MNLRRLLVRTVFLLALFLIAGMWMHQFSSWEKVDLSPQDVNRFIGPFASEQDALRELSRQVRLHPRAQKFMLRRGTGWTWYGRDETEQSWTTYDRKTGKLQDNVMGGNCNGEWVRVTDQRIHAVAAQRGAIDDLAQHGCKCLCP